METIEQLTQRVNVMLDKSENMRVSAGKVLLELQQRIKDKSNPEGERWKWRWEAYVTQELKRPLATIRRYLTFARAPDPAARAAEESRASSRRGRECERRRSLGLPSARAIGEPPLASQAVLDEVEGIQAEHAAQVRQELAKLWALWKTVSEEAQYEFLRQLGYDVAALQP